MNKMRARCLRLTRDNAGVRKPQRRIGLLFETCAVCVSKDERNVKAHRKIT